MPHDLPLTEIEKICGAIRQLLNDDWELLISSGLERSVSSKLMCYLQIAFPEFHVDHEYNKSLDLRKIIATPRIRRGGGESADIVIHKRRTHTHNYMAFEVKIDREDFRDRQKLSILTHPDGEYRYEFGIYIVISSHPDSPSIRIIDIYDEGVISNDKSNAIRAYITE